MSRLPRDTKLTTVKARRYTSTFLYAFMALYLIKQPPLSLQSSLLHVQLTSYICTQFWQNFRWEQLKTPVIIIFQILWLVYVIFINMTIYKSIQITPQRLFYHICFKTDDNVISWRAQIVQQYCKICWYKMNSFIDNKTEMAVVLTCSYTLETRTTIHCLPVFLKLWSMHSYWSTHSVRSR